MIPLEKAISSLLRAAALVFAVAILSLCCLLVLFKIWPVLLILALLVFTCWWYQENRSRDTPGLGLIRWICTGVAGILFLVVASITLLLCLAILLRHPWLVLFGLAAFWLWRRHVEPGKITKRISHTRETW